MPALRTVAAGVEIDLKVVPGASRERIAGLLGEALKVQIAVPPERGKANAAIIALFSKTLGIHRGNISISRGATSPHKTILIRGGRAEEIAPLLGLNT